MSEDVSILTRPYGRMLSPLWRMQKKEQKVSILTRPYGRMLCGRFSRGTTGRGGFNPHPPLRADAIPTFDLDDHTNGEFQSSPALTGGCYADTFSCSTGLWRFNPHPPLRADAIRLPGLHTQPGRGVSILTRPYGRMLYTCGHLSDGRDWFQSSPALTGGCYDERRHQHDARQAVSILTRPYGRMLFPALLAVGAEEAVSILTRPYGRMLWCPGRGLCAL